MTAGIESGLLENILPLFKVKYILTLSRHIVKHFSYLNLFFYKSRNRLPAKKGSRLSGILCRERSALPTKKAHALSAWATAGVVRVELTSTVLETAVLPLNYTPVPQASDF